MESVEVQEIEPQQTEEQEQEESSEQLVDVSVTSVSEQHLKSVLESLVFVSEKPVPLRKLVRLTKAPQENIVRLLEELQEDYAERGIRLVEVGTGYQFRTAAVNAPFVRDFVAARPVRLTRAQVETLAIAAYRQPLTRPELEEIRGVDSGSALKVLLDRGLLRILGRKDEPGRPLLYGTTPEFLDFFGLKSLAELPTLQEFSELSDESKELFARKMGEPLDLQSIADAAKLADGERVFEDESDEDDDEEDEENAGAQSEASDADDEDDDDEDDDDEDDDDEDDDDEDDDDEDDDDEDDDDEDADDEDDDDEDADDEDADDEDADEDADDEDADEDEDDDEDDDEDP